MGELFSDDDLKDILEGFNESVAPEEEEDVEMEASRRRYEEIIKKHKSD